MTTPALQAAFDALSGNQKLILALMAMAGEPMGRVRIAEHLKQAQVSDADDDQMAHDLAKMQAAGMASQVTTRGWVASADLAWPAMKAALDAGHFAPLWSAYVDLTPLRRNWEGNAILRSYRQGVALLRMALVGGAPPSEVMALLASCMSCHEASYLHPIIDICARPFEPEMLARIHPSMRDQVLTVLIDHSQREPLLAPLVRPFAERHLANASSSMALRVAMTEHFILCARLADAVQAIKGLDESQALYFSSAILMLRDDVAAALTGFEAALKALRRESGKRKAYFSGIGGYLYVLGMLRSGDPRQLKNADAYLDIATRAVQNHDTAAYQQLSMLRQVRAGTVDPEVFPTRSWETAMQPFMLRALMHFWLSQPQLQDKRAALEDMLAISEQAGFDLISAQLASVLGHLGGVSHERRATELRQVHHVSDMALWFAREEAWERQLNALINLQPPVNAEVVKEARLVWLVKYDAHWGIQSLEPREQKRDAQGGWSRGRPVALKRLYEDGDKMDFLTAQDLVVTRLIQELRYYSGGYRYELDDEAAIVALIGHPLLFWMESPGTRVEVLPGEPELLVKADPVNVTITMRPPVTGADDDVLITRETPTRLRVVRVTDEHRRIGSIIGEKGLVVPLAAEKQVLKAISAISSIVTVQSDIGGGAADIAQVPADSRMHVHLLPYQQGLRMQIQVRPLPGSGAYYTPGSGAESVIADVNGVRTEARRDLNAEREAERQLVAACQALEEAELDHGEWLIGQPVICLELLTELQAMDPARVIIAWPEGEPFRVTQQADSKSMRLSIKRDKDWFAASGEIQVDENRVLDLRTLLDSLKSNRSRFVALGDNQFMALSSELHRRLMDLSSFGTEHGGAVRVHALASFALEELARSVDAVDTDKAWREHLKRIASSAAFTPVLPTTLQADLRDYQVEGFEWLARLAHLGVGACLADDMGLGKTLQALALIVSRAPQGPTLVIAPTSVCTNWMAEASRFAPTLNLKLFGSGDRLAMLADAGPFDLVVASYGLLQLEAPLFAKVRWTNIVLDEAQAIKNNATKRSQAVMALQGDFRMVATGTPLENHLGELWNLFRFINPGLLGSADQFNVRFAGPIERSQDKALEAEARSRLRRLIQPFILRRTKAQVLAELPPRTEIVLPVELTEDETALYESLRRDAIEKLTTTEAPEGQKSIQILAEMMRLRRACCNPNLVAPELALQSSKLLAFSRLVDDLLANRHKVLVFSQFVDHLTLIRRHLETRGVSYQYLDGATSMQERQKRVEAFQGGEGDVFLISLKAGGVGINLTAADYVIHMDPWWNPAVEDQASDRAHRMGQQRPVTIYRLVARHTIEEGIVELHKHKRDLADSLLEGSDVSARLSPDDMLRMLREGA
ncbi:DEAD/DEAH box helicase [Massilia sp. PAMC28688]|uniref:DEAD/DEAH box helicase n=1 Tax=Massilia sp. PAMC28688 TaxID=2861283 RepID=UPI001C639409|nr:DEAD/DEAH box helicase [Massilia sp. PAMC28688]QYF95353.1 DEAD/DEAH box helicase [Massilia sp. PAMC28688]